MRGGMGGREEREMDIPALSPAPRIFALQDEALQERAANSLVRDLSY